MIFKDLHPFYRQAGRYLIVLLFFKIIGFFEVPAIICVSCSCPRYRLRDIAYILFKRMQIQICNENDKHIEIIRSE